MKIAIGSDHGGYALKLEVEKHLTERGIEWEDLGCHSTESCDYPTFGKLVGEAVTKGGYDLGLLFCGTGIGISMAANKVKGVLAALVTDVYSAERARKSNDANVVCFGAFTIGIRLMEMLADTFLTSEFEPGCRSQPKVDRIREYEALGQ